MKPTIHLGDLTLRPVADGDLDRPCELLWQEDVCRFLEGQSRVCNRKSQMLRQTCVQNSTLPPGSGANTFTGADPSAVMYSCGVPRSMTYVP